MDTINKPVVVISGAAKGIGKACVDTFVERGWHVAAIDVDPLLVAEGPRADVTTLIADISDTDALARAWQNVSVPVTALINAAGVFPPTSLDTLDVLQYRRIFDINVLGSLLLGQRASRDMNDGGAIVNFSSTNGYVARADQIVYAASKAAIISVTRSMAADLARRRIRVNAIAPGPVETEGFRAIPGRLDEAIAQVPLGRVQSPKEVAEIAFWLVDSDGAKFITGETIVCSGGLFMR